MSEYTFKPLNEVDTVEAPADGTTVMGFQGGVPIQMPMGAIKGSGGVFVIDTGAADFELNRASEEYGNQVKEALLEGKQVWVYTEGVTGTDPSASYPYAFQYAQPSGFSIVNFGSSRYILDLEFADRPILEFPITFGEATV